MMSRLCLVVACLSLACARLTRPGSETTSSSSSAGYGQDSMGQVLLQVGQQMSAAHAFNHYKAQFSRTYESQEHKMREQIFHKRVAEMEAHNVRMPRHSWRAGVNHLTDRTDTELLQMRGYRRHGAILHGKPESQSLAEKACMSASQKCHSMAGGGSCCHGLVCGAKGVCQKAKEIPAELDWSKVLVGSGNIANQGACGSCWAIAAQGAVEMQASLLTNKSVSLSAQGMVGCTPNPHECGGTGGCDGATPELAFEWASENGIVLSSEVAYTAETKCPKHSKPSVTLQGFVRLQENQAMSVLQSLVSAGPLAVAVDASMWMSYMSGVFDNCQKNPVVDHAVLLMGYGKDTKLNVAFWQIRNSWGKEFGEEGFLRLRRHAPDGEEPCAWDYEPEKGNGCKGGPKKIWVCGECGVLSDVVYPVGTQVVASGGSAQEHVSQGNLGGTWGPL